jgi:hypothetical protein
LAVNPNVNAFVKPSNVTGGTISKAAKHLVIIWVRLAIIGIKANRPDTVCQQDARLTFLD